MRRTVLRDSASRRLISRRLCPCACRVRTAVRISVGVMRVLPLKRGGQGVDRRPQAWRGRDQRRRQRAQRRHTLAQACDHRLEAAQIADAFAFGAVAQALAGAPRLVRPQGVDEQAGFG